MSVKLGILKAIVRKRDVFCCECLVQYTQDVDHKIPKMYGGGNTLENLQGLCVRCHRIKSKKEMALWRSVRRIKQGKIKLRSLPEFKSIPGFTWVEGVDYHTPRTIEKLRQLKLSTWKRP